MVTYRPLSEPLLVVMCWLATTHTFYTDLLTKTVTRLHKNALPLDGPVNDTLVNSIILIAVTLTLICLC